MSIQHFYHSSLSSNAHSALNITFLPQQTILTYTLAILFSWLQNYSFKTHSSLNILLSLNSYMEKKWLFVSNCYKQHKALSGLEQVLVLNCLIQARCAGLNIVRSAGKLFGQTPTLTL